MAKANSLSPIGISAVKVLARLAAKKAVQAKLRDQGVRLTTYPYAELIRQVAEYLDNHPELYQQALERAKLMTAEGVFSKRAQRALQMVLVTFYSYKNKLRKANTGPCVPSVPSVPEGNKYHKRK